MAASNQKSPLIDALSGAVESRVAAHDKLWGAGVAPDLLEQGSIHLCQSGLGYRGSLGQLLHQVGLGGLWRASWPRAKSIREIAAASGGLRVDAQLCRAVEREWASAFSPSDARAVPDRLELFGKGGQVDSHRAAGGGDLVGTFIVCLQEPNRGRGGAGGAVRFRPRGAEGAAPTTKAPNMDACTWVAFYPELEHDVTPVRYDGDFRVALTFHMYAPSSDSPVLRRAAALCRQRAHSVASAVPSMPAEIAHLVGEYALGRAELAVADLRAPLGSLYAACKGAGSPSVVFLLQQASGLCDETLRGSDLLLRDTLSTIDGLLVRLAPVASHYRYSNCMSVRGCASCPKERSRVAHNVRLLAGTSEKELFFGKVRQDMVISREATAGQDRAGDSCRPYEINAVYAQLALIVTSP